jgi:hypothetical protein
MERRAGWKRDAATMSAAGGCDRAPDTNFDEFGKIGAGEGIRTLDPDLGKVVLYP